MSSGTEAAISSTFWALTAVLAPPAAEPDPESEFFEHPERVKAPAVATTTATRHQRTPLS